MGIQRITSGILANNSISATDIAAGTITGDKLATGQITGNLVATNAISQNNIVSVNASVASVGTLPKSRLPTDSILQVVHLETNGYTTNATNTFNDVPNMSLAITPTSASSRILVCVKLSGCGKYSGNTWGRFRLLRDGSQINIFNDSAGWTSSTLEVNHTIAYDYMDSPATTSAVTYKVQFCSGNNTSAAQVGNYVGTNTYARHSFVLMEIAA